MPSSVPLFRPTTCEDMHQQISLWSNRPQLSTRNVRRRLVEKIVEDLGHNYDREVPYGAVGTRVMEGLRELDPVAYVRYASIYRRFDEANDFVQEVNKLEKPHDTLTARLPGI